MPVYPAQWLVQNRVLYARARDQVTMEDLMSHNQQILQMIEQGVPPVHIVLQTENMLSPPATIREIKRVYTFAQHPSAGWLISINNGNTTLDFLNSMVTKFLRTPYRSSESLALAVSFLESVDATLRHDTSYETVNVRDEHISNSLNV